MQNLDPYEKISQEVAESSKKAAYNAEKKKFFMDILDKKILNELQQNASLTNNELALRVGSTPATCHRRRKELYRTGVIDRTVAIVKAEAVSRELTTVIVGIVLKTQTPPELKTFSEFLVNHRSVKMAWLTTGEFDYIIIGAFSDTPQYLRFINEELIKHTNFSNYRTFAALDELKFDTSRNF